MLGEVQWYEPKKGYGFILSHDKSVLKPIYFHRSEFLNINTVHNGQLLEFDTTPGEKGLKAVHIKYAVS